LGVLTGQIGHLRFRSHSFSKGAPADSDDFMIYEKPTRPILKVQCLEPEDNYVVKMLNRNMDNYDVDKKRLCFHTDDFLLTLPTCHAFRS
jgi:hypothetical protein